MFVCKRTVECLNATGYESSLKKYVVSLYTSNLNLSSRCVFRSSMSYSWIETVLLKTPGSYWRPSSKTQRSRC
jgi:hypothetical protein